MKGRMKRLTASWKDVQKIMKKIIKVIEQRKELTVTEEKIYLEKVFIKCGSGPVSMKQIRSP